MFGDYDIDQFIKMEVLFLKLIYKLKWRTFKALIFNIKIIKSQNNDKCYNLIGGLY